MKSKKIQYFILAIFITAIIFLIIYFFVPQKLISNINEIDVVKIMYHGSEVSIENNKLLNILNKYYYRKTFKDYFPYSPEKIDIEIFLIEKRKPKYILLGEFNIWYESADAGAYNILNGKKLKNELNIIFLKYLDKLKD
ncbi:MAG: hypothetical protein PHT78_09980 [Desulfitobacteriaceae bacterium]|nr:hypothetical protein [Desulfitobacteriaceae bacterium]